MLKWDKNGKKQNVRKHSCPSLSKASSSSFLGSSTIEKKGVFVWKDEAGVVLSVGEGPLKVQPTMFDGSRCRREVSAPSSFGGDPTRAQPYRLPPRRASLLLNGRQAAARL